MKVLIIDDERLARLELKKLLAAHTDIEIVGECSNAKEALIQINEKSPDLIFLDIQMPEINGFELLAQLSIVPEVIFVTAYDEYALKAFDVSAIDYLLKPVQSTRLEEAIKKIKPRERGNELPSNRTYLNEQDKVFVKDGENCWFVKLDDIRLFESEGNYVRIYFDKNRPLVLKSLNSLEEKLNPKSFFRVSRKHMVNLKWVDQIENWFNGGLMVVLKGGDKIEVSRRQAVRFKEMMTL